MRELSTRVRQSCHLAVRSEEQMVVVARVESPGSLGFSVRPGYRRSLLEASSGVVLYAFQPDGVRESLRTGLKAGRARLKAFEARAAAVRERGYERSASDFVRGVTDISAPVISDGGAVAAMTIPFVETSPPAATLQETLDLLRATAAQVSGELAAH
jgi:DNA-binding IclR family transcriptional regulator